MEPPPEETAVKRKREPGEINPLPTYLMDLRCSICLITLYQDLSMVCPSSESCVKGGHVMCSKCMETYTSRSAFSRCPVCTTYI